MPPKLIFVSTVQSHLQHYAEPSTEPQPASTSTLSSTLLPLGPGTLTHNASGVPIVVVCTKADLIDESTEITAGATGMGGMVKGKGGEWEERTDGIMQVLRTICLKCMFCYISDSSFSNLSRWGRTAIYYSATCNSPALTSIRATSAVHPSSTITRDGFRRSGADKEHLSVST